MAQNPVPNSAPAGANPGDPRLDLPWGTAARRRAPRHGLSAIRPSAIGQRLLRLTALLLCLPLPAALADELPAYPGNAVFRQLQLAAQDCGRENNSATCTPARDQADRLMDHPRLPAACKDVLWEIREGSQVTTLNSYTRREALNRAAGDLMAICRAPAKPTPSTGKPSSPFQR
ncbi:hypothetical protein [Synechococcus sp. CS-1328]|uniref:hypothetical protein n=1 Tax=Synechococcus sp. CS-1328 TaxID=2847976 RepID=UPI00223B4FFF|nr:hypothetical protein [Synechococcus sp. CS-1328]MCT0223580.1 hypothetical protein [Synechococcus sp. CS-1328]